MAKDLIRKGNKSEKRLLQFRTKQNEIRANLHDVENDFEDLDEDYEPPFLPEEFEELPIEEAKVEFFKPIFWHYDNGGENTEQMKAALTLLWEEGLAILNAWNGDKTRIQGSSELQEALASAFGLDALDSKLLSQTELTRMVFRIPPPALKTARKNYVYLRHETNIPAILVSEDLLINSNRPRFQAGAEDRKIISLLNALDQLGDHQRDMENINNLGEPLYKTLIERFTKWLSFKQAHEEIRERAPIAVFFIEQAYLPHEGTDQIYSFKQWPKERLEPFCLMLAAFGKLATIPPYPYVVTLFLYFLEYLSEIGYWTIDEGTREFLEAFHTALIQSEEAIQGFDGYLTREKLLAAELYGYSYQNYDNHAGNIRFDKLMPNDVRCLEVARAYKWSSARIAKDLNVEQRKVTDITESFERALSIVDARGPIDSFKTAVKDLLKATFGQSGATNEKIEKVIEKIGYRVSDLGYLLEREGSFILDYHDELIGSQSFDESIERTHPGDEDPKSQAENS